MRLRRIAIIAVLVAGSLITLDSQQAPTGWPANGAMSIAPSSAVTGGGQVSKSLLFVPDNTYDIGASGATRPRVGYFGTAVAVGTTPSTVGGIRLPADNGSVGLISFRNNANSANVVGMYIGTGDQIIVGNGATVQVDGPLDFSSAGGSISRYKSVTTAGWGVPAINGYGNTAGATGVTASIATYTVGAADGTFEVSANCLVTTATTHSFSLDVTYTDEGNTARTMILPIYSVAGTPVANALIVNTGGTVPYHAPAITIRAKAATAITVRTSAGGTYTSVVYNARGTIKQVS